MAIPPKILRGIAFLYYEFLRMLEKNCCNGSNTHSPGFLHYVTTFLFVFLQVSVIFHTDKNVVLTQTSLHASPPPRYQNQTIKMS